MSPLAPHLASQHHNAYPAKRMTKPSNVSSNTCSSTSLGHVGTGELPNLWGIGLVICHPDLCDASLGPQFDAHCNCISATCLEEYQIPQLLFATEAPVFPFLTCET